MALIDDIISAAVDHTVPIGALLRKCMVLESMSPNTAFSTWLNKELDGYGKEDELPKYRDIYVHSYGLFSGMTVQMDNQPISLHHLSETHRKLVEKCRLTQSAASYEERPNESGDAAIPWPPFLTVKYQEKIYRGGDPVLIRAWQSIPGSVLVDLLETVRNRVLRFALDLKKQQGSGELQDVPQDAIEKSVEKHIFGGKLINWT